MRYRALTAEPERTVEGIYDHFGLELTPAYRSRLRALITRKPDGGYGHNVYRFEDYGLDPAEARERSSEYMSRFDVEEEVAVP